jgi:hypothetical protein
MPERKYVAMALLTLGVLEFSFVGMIPPLAHGGLAAVLLAYGLWAILPLISYPETNKSADVIASEGTGRFILDIGWALASLLIVRLLYLVANVAYLGMALSKLQPAMVTDQSEPVFWSYVLNVFDQTVPPATELMRAVWSNLRSVGLDKSQLGTVLFDWSAWVSIGLIGVSAVVSVITLLLKRKASKQWMMWKLAVDRILGPFQH